MHLVENTLRASAAGSGGGSGASGAATGALVTAGASEEECLLQAEANDSANDRTSPTRACVQIMSCLLIRWNVGRRYSNSNTNDANEGNFQARFGPVILVEPSCVRRQ